MTRKTEKKTVRTGDAVGVYNVLKKQNLLKLCREDRGAVLRASRALRGVARDFEEFAKDVQERLRPDNFDSVMEKAQRFTELTEDEKVEVNATIEAYQRSVDECVQPELDKEREIDGFEPLSEDARDGLADEGLDVQTLLLVEDVCG